MSESTFSLQYVDRNSPIHRTYPLAKLAWVFVVAAGLFLYREPASGAIMLLVVFLTAIMIARVPLRTVLRSSKLIFGLGILLMIFHFFANPGQPVYYVGPLTITDVGLHEGPIFFFRLSVVVLASAAATAIECRGFGAYPDRTYVKSVTFKKRSLILPLLFLLLTTALIVIERVPLA